MIQMVEREKKERIQSNEMEDRKKLLPYWNKTCWLMLFTSLTPFSSDSHAHIPNFPPLLYYLTFFSFIFNYHFIYDYSQQFKFVELWRHRVIVLLRPELSLGAHVWPMRAKSWPLTLSRRLNELLLYIDTVIYLFFSFSSSSCDAPTHLFLCRQTHLSLLWVFQNKSKQNCGHVVGCA